MSGGRPVYHGDFDWPGHRHRRRGDPPPRCHTLADVGRRLSRRPRRPHRSRPPGRTAKATPWDPEPAGAMAGAARLRGGRRRPPRRGPACRGTFGGRRRTEPRPAHDRLNGAVAVLPRRGNGPGRRRARYVPCANGGAAGPLTGRVRSVPYRSNGVDSFVRGLACEGASYGAGHPEVDPDKGGEGIPRRLKRRLRRGSQGRRSSSTLAQMKHICPGELVSADQNQT
jgi:hypothetical protein